MDPNDLTEPDPLSAGCFAAEQGTAPGGATGLRPRAQRGALSALRDTSLSAR